jgi:hypothetical protein
MFFGKFVYAALLFVFTQLWPSMAMSSEDWFLSDMYASKKVIACGDDLSFDLLLSGNTFVLHEGSCRKYDVPDAVSYLGWHFVTPPDYTKSVSFFQGQSFLESRESFIQEDAEAVRKYYGEDEYGPVLFIWPAPKSLLGYAEFAAPHDNEHQFQYEESFPFEATTPTSIAYASFLQ